MSNNKTTQQEAYVVTQFSTEQQWLDSLNLPTTPELFVIDIVLPDKTTVFFGVRELYWHEAVDAEVHAFRNNERGEMYFSGEYERRQILNKALVWVAHPASKQHVVATKTVEVLKCISQDAADLLWNAYENYVTLSPQEVEALYTASQKYFNGLSYAGWPTPSLIIEVDKMHTVARMTRAELRSITISDWERMQVIEMARSEVYAGNDSKRIGEDVSPDELKDMALREMSAFPNFLPPGMR